MAETALMKYIFLDIVKFSHKRTVESQSHIIDNLNRIVLESISELKIADENVLYLPTGDGICIALINLIDPYDIHMQISLLILNRLADYNSKQNDQSKIFSIRIGINENYDNLITDINGRKNVAGAGINFAQRVMDFSEDNQIFISESVHEKLEQRDAYTGKFISFTKQIKHGLKPTCYRFLDKTLPYLNSSINEQIIDIPKMPEIVANYCTLLTIFEPNIITQSGTGSKNYSIMIILSYIALDITEYSSLTEIDKRKWSTKLFNSNIDNFPKALKHIDDSFFWLLVASRKYHINELLLNQWSGCFSNDYLTITQKGEEELLEWWPDKIKVNTDLITFLYPKILI